jgi:hypothetical protein
MGQKNYLLIYNSNLSFDNDAYHIDSVANLLQFMIETCFFF